MRRISLRIHWLISATLLLCATAATSNAQTPYKTLNIPGTIECEDFDNGGEGVAYHDTSPGNSGGQYRSTDVDIGYTNDGPGSLAVGYVYAGEWLKYTVNVAKTSTYTIKFRVNSWGTNGAFHLEVDGANVTGTLTIPGVGGATWLFVTKTGVALTAGQHVLKLSMDTNCVGGYGGVGDFNYLTFLDESASDLALAVTECPAESAMGGFTTYSVTLTNNGIATATNVTVSAPVPSNTYFNYLYNNGGGAYNSTTGVWTVASLPSGSSVTLQYAAIRYTHGSSTWSVSITSADQADPNAANNSDSRTIGEATIGLAIGFVSSTKSSATTYDIVLQATLKNYGTVTLSSLQSQLDLGSLLAGHTWSVTSTPTGTLSGNASYNGTTNKNLLAAGVSLASGASGNVQLTIRITVWGDGFNLSATATASSPSGVTTQDDSTSGFDPDPDGDLNPQPNNLLTWVPTPYIDLQLTLAAPADTPPYQAITLTATLKNNNGNYAATGIAVSVPVPTKHQFSSLINPGVNGSYNSATGVWTVTSLPAGASTTLQLSVTRNQTGDAFWSLSVTGYDQVESNGANNSASATIKYSALGVAKNVVSVVRNADLTFTVTADYTGKNLGDVTVSSVKLGYDSWPFVFDSVVSAPQLLSGPASITPNASYPSGPDNATIVTGGVLAPGESFAVRVVTRWKLPNGSSYASGGADASISGSAGSAIVSNAIKGTDPDPDGDHLPGNGAPALTAGIMDARLGLAQAVATVYNSDGTFSATFSVLVRNYSGGGYSLNDVQVSCPLSTIFPAPAAFSVTSGPSLSGATTLTANASFNGSTNANLLAAGGTLAAAGGANDRATITFTVRVTPNGVTSPSGNATATADYTFYQLITLSDTSTSGADPDPDADANPMNNSVATVIGLLYVAVEVGPSGSPSATGTDGTNLTDYVNKTISAGLAGVSPGGVTTAPGSATFTNTLKNWGSSTDSFKITATAPAGFIVQAGTGGSYTTITGGGFYTVSGVAYNATANFDVVVTAPAGSTVLTPYDVAVTATSVADSTKSNLVIDRLYTGFIRVTTTATVLDSGGNPTANLVPGGIIEYAVNYDNVSGTGGTGCVQLTASNLVITEDGAGGSNNWSGRSAHIAGSSTDSRGGTITGDTAGSSLLTLTITSLPPGASGTWKFRRRLN